MKFSTINEINVSRDQVNVFGGYNHNIEISDGEFYDMKNLSSDNYPVVSPRKRRGHYLHDDDNVINGMIAKDSLCYVKGNKLFINGYEQSVVLTDSPKQMVSMGAYIIIMPDKVWVNTGNIDASHLADWGSIEKEWKGVDDNYVYFTMCDLSGAEYDDAVVRPEPPEAPENLLYWVDTSQKPHILKQYSETNKTWVQVPTTYIKISAPNIANGFSQYDGVKLNITDENILEVEQIAELNGKTHVIYDLKHNDGGAGDYIIIVGILDSMQELEIITGDEMSVKREMPKMDFVIESENRLWGCRYGLNNDNKVVNEIYACKLGDFKNWNCFMGISTDSYAASVGTDGQFTGAITYLGYPMFFKEECFHKVYGNFPSNYQIQTTACRGVMKGAGKSLAIVNGTLYYKSRNGISAYDGSLPAEISSFLGNVKYSGLDEDYDDVLRNGAVAGSHMNKLYMSMKSEIDNKWYLFVYDTSKGLWHKEDNTRVYYFCSCRNEMYFSGLDEHDIHTVFGTMGNGEGLEKEGSIRWECETGDLGLGLPDKKYISNILVRLAMSVGSNLQVFIKYDEVGGWNSVCNLNSTYLRSFSLPIRPNRCDNFKLKFVGCGDILIYSISKTLEQGSDL